VVSILYVLLNIVFLRQASLDQLQGQIEIGQIASNNIFGNKGGFIISMAIAFMLISSISAMIWAGPRVIHTMAEDYLLWNYFKFKNKNNIPVRAILLQSGIAIFLIITGTFEQVLIYSGFILNLFAALAVGGVFILRKRGLNKDGFSSPFFPVPQVLFLVLSLWILVYLLYAQPLESGLGLINLIIGFGTYKYSKYISKRRLETGNK